MNRTKKRFLIPGVLGGLLILSLSIMFKSSPNVQPNFDKARPVTVEVLEHKSKAPSVVAFGLVAPKHSWQAIAEVGGKVIYRHPELESGRLLPAGTLVLEIDPLAYELKEAQALANVSATNAQLMRITQEEQNLRVSLAIEQEKLTLVDQEYQRKRALKKKNLISSSDVDGQKQALLAQQKMLQDLTSALSLLPDDKKVAQAQLKINQSLLSDAQRQLADTRLTLPFDARIADVNVEHAQAVASGSVLFEAHQIGAVEIKAELSLQDAEMLMSSVPNLPALGELPNVEDINFVVEIELQLGKKVHRWPAKLTRIADNINPQQATIGFYLEVNQEANNKGVRSAPPLTKGMFVTAKIQGFSSDTLFIPEKALHGSQVYIMDEEQNLSIRKVQIDFRNADGVAVSGDIQAGELLILNDLIPAFSGMSLKVLEPRL